MSTPTAPRPVPAPAPGEHAPVRGTARLLRGWAAAAVATVLAAGSHTLANLVEAGASHAAHDAGPAPILWILTLALAGPVCTALAGRRLSWWRLSAAVAASQLLFHWLYSATAMGATAPSLTGAGVHAGHGAQAGPAEGLATTSTTAGAVDAAGSWGSGAETAAHSDSPAMAAAHVLAAVVTVLALRRGDVLAARVAELAAGLILRSPGARLARWVPAVPVRRASAAHRQLVRRPQDVLLPSLRLRGPPAGSPLALAA